MADILTQLSYAMKNRTFSQPTAVQKYSTVVTFINYSHTGASVDIDARVVYRKICTGHISWVYGTCTGVSGNISHPHMSHSCGHSKVLWVSTLKQALECLVDMWREKMNLGIKTRMLFCMRIIIGIFKFILICSKYVLECAFVSRCNTTFSILFRILQRCIMLPNQWSSVSGSGPTILPIIITKNQ